MIQKYVSSSHLSVDQEDPKTLISAHFVLWFTGLSAAGKSTLAHCVAEKLFAYNYHAFILDGDNIRQRLCADLDFSDADRHENIRRIGEVSHLFYDAGVISVVACISPFFHDRAIIRDMFPPGGFIEIYCNTPLEICEQRDPKGLYKKAHARELLNFTGISSSYEPPKDPEIIVNTGYENVEHCVQQVIDYLVSRKKITLVDSN